MAFSDMENNRTVSLDMLITDVNVRTAKNGSEYMDMTLTSGTESVVAKMWSSERFAAAYPDDYNKISGEPGTVVKVQGKVNEFQGRKQLIIDRIKVVKDADPCEYIPASPVAVDKLEEDLRSIIDAVKDEGIKAFLNVLFSGTVYEAFKDAPAAKTFHHNYLHGLMEHTIQICRLAAGVTDSYPVGLIDNDILIAGILAHDIGKITEYENILGRIDITNAGKLLGHMIIGAEMVSQAAEASGLERDKAQKIEHIVLAHHGQREYGAAVLPKTIEAFIVHMLDNIDAKMKRFETIVNENSGRSWSPRERMFNDTELFLD